MNLQLLNPYQIIEYLKAENKKLQSRVSELEAELETENSKEEEADDIVD